MPKEKKSATVAIGPAVRRGPGKLDHGAHRDMKCDPRVANRSSDFFFDDLTHPDQLFDIGDQRDHDLETRVATGFDPAHQRFGSSPRLHPVQVIDHQPEPDPAQAEHGIGLLPFGDLVGHRLQVVDRPSLLRPEAHLVLEVETGRKELVKRRVEEPDHHREPVHRLEQALEVPDLELLQLVEGRRSPASGRRRG